MSFKPFIPADQNLKEFTFRAMFIGVILAALLGAANAYLGLKAGMTIAATYPAAVLGMALLRLFKDNNILEENMVRTVGSIGESVAAGAIFTLPAFLISGVWDPEFFGSFAGYWKSTVIMLVGGIVGILFVTLLRRVMVEDTSLPFPESVAASEIHKAGRSGVTGAKFLFSAMAVGGLIEFLKNFGVLKAKWEAFVGFANKIIPGTAKPRRWVQRRFLRWWIPVQIPCPESRVSGRRLYHRPGAGGIELCWWCTGMGTVCAFAHVDPGPTISALY